MISRQRFAELADAYGGDLARWPAAERAGALALMAAAAEETDALLAQARALDGALEALDAPAPASEVLARRLLKAAPKPAGPPIWAAMAASVVLGLVAGFGGVRAWDGSASIDSAMSQALGGEDGWSEMGQDG